MRKLVDILSARSYHLGEAASTQGEQPSQEQLIADLKMVITSNETYFRFCIAALVTVFAGCCFLTYAYRANTLAITGLFTATGISFAAIAPQMLSFWREKVRTDTVLVMARQLPTGETMQLIQLLLASGK